MHCRCPRKIHEPSLAHRKGTNFSAEIFTYHLQTSDTALHCVMLVYNWKMFHRLQSIDFFLSCITSLVPVIRRIEGIAGGKSDGS